MEGIGQDWSGKDRGRSQGGRGASGLIGESEPFQPWRADWLSADAGFRARCGVNPGGSAAFVTGIGGRRGGAGGTADRCVDGRGINAGSASWRSFRGSAPDSWYDTCLYPGRPDPGAGSERDEEGPDAQFAVRAGVGRPACVARRSPGKAMRVEGR